MVWPTTPFWNNGGISIERLDPRLEELSRRARLDSSSETSDGSSEGRRDLFPESSARTAITDLGSVDGLAPPDPSSTEPRDPLPPDDVDT